MKKIIIILGIMAVICIAAIGIMYLPKQPIDVVSSSTVNWAKNEAPAQSTHIHYATLDVLLLDISNNEIGKNSCDDGALLYMDNHEIKLLSDIEIDDTYIIKDIIFNLNNHTLIFGNDGFIQLDNTIICNGNFSIIGEYTEERLIQSITNSTINNCNFSISAQANILYILYCNEGASLTVINSAFITEKSPIYSLYTVCSEGNLTVSNCIFNLSLDTDNEIERTYCIAVLSRSHTLNIEYTEIKNINYDTYGTAYGIFCNPQVAEASILNCNVYTDSHYLMLDNNYGSIAVGIQVRGLKTIIDGCTVRGIHSALSCAGDATINNSHFESTGHGGIYFGRNTRKDADGNDLPVLYKVSNSTIAWSAPDGLFADDYQRDDCAGDNGASCYIGGSTNATGITVYMDSCKLIGRRYAAVLRGTSNEHDNSLYMTNTILDQPMRIDNETLKFYVGSGCNIAQDSEVYWKKVKTTYSQIEGTSVVFEESGAI